MLILSVPQALESAKIREDCINKGFNKRLY